MPALKEALAQLTVSKIEVVSDHTEDRTANLEALFLEKGFVSLTNPSRFAPLAFECDGDGNCECSCVSPTYCSTGCGSHCIIAE